MELIIQTHGTKLGKKGEMFVVTKYDGEKINVPTIELERIILSPGVSLTTDVMIMALKKGIEILITDSYSNTVSKITNEKFGSTSKIRRNQYKYFSEDFGTEIAKDLIVKKLVRMKELFSEEKEFSKKIEKYIAEINNITGNSEQTRQKIMGYEGHITKEMYEIINKILPQNYKFKVREHQNAKEEFNIMLNYTYGILYRICESELINVGIDPYYGILHTDNYNKKSFLFDYIEIFRSYAIDVVIKLIKNKRIRKSFFESGNISLEGRKMIIESFKLYLGKTELYNEKNYKRKEIIKLEAVKIASKLKDLEI